MESAKVPPMSDLDQDRYVQSTLHYELHVLTLPIHDRMNYLVRLTRRTMNYIQAGKDNLLAVLSQEGASGCDL